MKPTGKKRITRIVVRVMIWGNRGTRDRTNTHQMCDRTQRGARTNREVLTGPTRSSRLWCRMALASCSSAVEARAWIGSSSRYDWRSAARAAALA